MREILFKAKTCNGEWVQGLLAHKDNKWYISNKAGQPFAFEVRPDTICQYTELTDKKLNLKWQGDIFQCSNGDYIERYYIEWDEYNLQWEAVCIADSDGNLPLCEFRADEIEVIGNIFDNPELLKEGAE